jgi:ATP-dependent Clp protease ATP-binding subunit ClpC
LELDKVGIRLDEYSIELQATPEAMDKLAQMGYDPEMGARPLRRVIQQQVEDSLSDALLAGDFEDCASIVIDVDDDEIVLQRGEKICDDNGDDMAEEEPTEAIAAG